MELISDYMFKQKWNSLEKNAWTYFKNGVKFIVETKKLKSTEALHVTFRRLINLKDVTWYSKCIY